MIDAEAADVLVLDQAEDRVEVRRVLRRHGEADADADAGGAAVADAAHGLLERADLDAHPVVVGLGAVDGDAAVGHADVGEPLGDLLVDERAVRRERHAHALRDRVGGEVDDVGPDERLAAGHHSAPPPQAARAAERAVTPTVTPAVPPAAFRPAPLPGLQPAYRSPLPARPRDGTDRGSLSRLARRFGIAEAVAVEGWTAEKFGHADHQALRLRQGRAEAKRGEASMLTSSCDGRHRSMRAGGPIVTP